MEQLGRHDYRTLQPGLGSMKRRWFGGLAWGTNRVKRFVAPGATHNVTGSDSRTDTAGVNLKHGVSPIIESRLR